MVSYGFAIALIMLLSVSFVSAGFFSNIYDGIFGGKITGKVTDGVNGVHSAIVIGSDGSRLSGATVTLVSDSSDEYEGIEGDNYGVYDITAPFGDYTLKVSASGHENYVHGSSVPVSDTTSNQGDIYTLIEAGIDGAEGVDGDEEDDVGGEGRVENQDGADPVMVVEYNFASDSDTDSGDVQSGAEIVSSDERGSVLELDGADGYTKVSSSGLSFDRGVSAMGWFNVDNFGSKGNEITGSWISKRDSFILSPNKDGSVDFFVNADGNWVSISSEAGKVVKDEWQHWAGTYDGSMARLYMNSVLLASAEVSGTLGTTGDICIGADCGIDGRFFDGMVDDVLIFTGALSADKVEEFYLESTDDAGNEVVSCEGRKIFDVELHDRDGKLGVTYNYEGGVKDEDIRVSDTITSGSGNGGGFRECPADLSASRKAPVDESGYFEAGFGTTCSYPSSSSSSSDDLRLKLRTDNPSAEVTMDSGTYTVTLVAASDSVATIQVTSADGSSESKEVKLDTSKRINGVIVSVTSVDEANIGLSATITLAKSDDNGHKIRVYDNECPRIFDEVSIDPVVEAREVICSSVSNDILKKVEELEDAGKKVGKKMGEDVFRGDYVILSYGFKAESVLLKVVSVINQQTGYQNDEVVFRDVLNEQNSYDLAITEEGKGTLSVNGQTYRVSYYGEPSNAEDTRYVKITRSDIGLVLDFSSCKIDDSEKPLDGDGNGGELGNRKSGKYINEKDYGALKYLESDRGVGTEGVEDFGIDGLKDGAYVRYGLSQKTQGVFVTVSEFDHSIGFEEFSRKVIRDQGLVRETVDYDSLTIAETERRIPKTGAIQGAHIVFANTNNDATIGSWASRDKIVTVTTESALKGHADVWPILLDYLKKHPSTLLPIECTEGCANALVQCLPYGTRTQGVGSSGEAVSEYCGLDDVFSVQKADGAVCTNNYECGSNVCVSGQCVEGNVLQKMFEFFRDLLGGNTVGSGEENSGLLG